MVSLLTALRLDRLGCSSLTFGDVPGHAAQEHLAGVDGTTVAPGRQLAAPGEGGFVHR